MALKSQRCGCVTDGNSRYNLLISSNRRLCLVMSLMIATYTVTQKHDTDVAHYSFNAHQPILVIFAETLLREYYIKWKFCIPSLLTNVFALPGETWTPKILSLQSPTRNRIWYILYYGFKIWWSNGNILMIFLKINLSSFVQFKRLRKIETTRCFVLGKIFTTHYRE